MTSKNNTQQPMTVASTLPEAGFVRLRQIIGDQKATPPKPALIPVCRSTWFDGVRKGRYPQGIKLSPRVTVWRVEDIRALIASPA